MSPRLRRVAAVLVTALAAALMPGATLAVGGTIVTVNQTDLGSTWFHTTLEGGTGAFVAGPSTPPLGDGSFAMTTGTPDDKSTIVTNLYTGAPLSDLTALDYWTYRDAGSTSPSYVAPSINIAIHTNAGGPGTGFATLVFEPLYSYGNDAIDDGVWQPWDTFAPSTTGFAGGWWTTQQVGAICPTACYATLATLQANAPDATILAVGVNVGRGPATFVGATDGLSLTMAGATTTFDFEDLAFDKDGCKNGGWVNFHAPVFKNQGDCVSFFASAKRQGPKTVEDRAAARAERRDSRAAAKETKRATKEAKSSKSEKSEKAGKGSSADKPAKSEKSDKGKGNSEGG